MTPLARRNQKKRQTASIVVFFLMFPGFYLYNWGQTLGLPAVLGGYVVAISALCLIITAPTYLFSVRRVGGPMWIDLAFWSALAFGTLWVIVSKIGLDARAQTDNYVGSLIIWATIYTFSCIVDFSNQVIRKLSLATLVLMNAIILTNIRLGAFSLNVPELEAGYQFFALIYILTLFVFLSNLESQFMSWIILFASFISLVFIGARTELFALLIAAVVFLNLRFFSLKGIVIQLGAVFAIISFLPTMESLKNNRISDLVFNSALGSRTDRAWAHEYALEVISRQPILGDFANYPPGHYAHNILSIYVDFGLTGFVLYLVAVGTAFYHLIKHLRSRLRLKQGALGVALFILIFTLLLLAKSGVYYLVPFTLGYTRTLVQKFEEERIAIDKFGLSAS